MKSLINLPRLLFPLLSLFAACGSAQVEQPIPPPDARYKADILLIVAHPDDDTGISSYLAKAVLDEGKSAAVIFTTRGNSGPNAVGTEQAKALGDVREMEARRSLAARGITNVWFLPGLDTATQDVLHSLENVSHGECLEEIVRLIRLTRPEVILTWLPAYVAGENHGDHQASGVMAVEGFDMAADPTAFPEQVTPPRQRLGINNYGEGLHPWQAKKLYFFSDASHPEFLKGHGPVYLATDKSRSKGISFSEINRLAWKEYASQVDFSDQVLRYYTDMPEYLVLGKSMVPAQPTEDVWSGIDAKVVGERATSAQPATGDEPALELGGAWHFYRQFYPAHGLKALEALMPPQTALGAYRQLWVPLLLRNPSREVAEIHLQVNTPQGWTGDIQEKTYHLEPGATYPVQLYLYAPSDSGNQPPQSVHWTATLNGHSIGELSLQVYSEYNGVPQ